MLQKFSFPWRKPLIYCDHRADKQRACTLVYLVVGFVYIHILSLRGGSGPRMFVIPLHLPHNALG